MTSLVRLTDFRDQASNTSSRKYYLFLFLLLWSFTTIAQPGNRKPRIVGQRTLTTTEEKSIAIQLSDLQVENTFFYPWGYSLTIYPGPNFTYSNNIITPAANFNGTLIVPVTIRDSDHESNRYDLRISVTPVNDKPVITGQQAISTDEDKAFALSPAHLMINDPDNSIFTLIIGTGNNYTVSGNNIIPSPDFAGPVLIPVSVNDGQITSDQFTLSLIVRPVNDPPRITGQQPLTTAANVPVAIALTHLTVKDPDDTYPTDLTLTVLPGANYTANGNQVTPASTFVGPLPVAVKVNDGAADSEVFQFQIEVTAPVAPANGKPMITKQVPLLINEDESIVIGLSHLTVTDADSPYPTGFTLQVSSGTNYTVTNNTTVVPAPNFSGNLTVKVTVSDGKNVSDPFNLIITVRPVNDPPVLSTSSQEPVLTQTGSKAIQLFKNIDIQDVDNDSLVLAEIGMEAPSYQAGSDQLLFVNTPVIKGIFDSQRGILALIGKASIAQYSQAIQSIQYNHSGAEPTTTKPIYVIVNDGQSNSNTLKKQIRFGDISIAFDIPTGFTPNGDRVNDTWSITPMKDTDTYRDVLVRVYTKSGVLVFESDDVKKEWDGHFNGEALPADVYFYTVDIKSQDLTTPIRGTITILR